MPRLPDRSWYDPLLDAHLHTGRHATDAVIGLEQYTGPRSLPIAIDIETPGLDRAFEVNCVTASWEWRGEVQSILLDPVRNPSDRPAFEALMGMASSLILHNSPFDLPALVHHKLLSIADIYKVADTLLLARMALPDVMVKRDLTTLSVNYLGMSDFADGMKKAFAAAGFKTIQAGYEGMDIDSPIYRQGAMADTIATLRLEPILRDMCRSWLTDHPFVEFGATTAAEADELIGVQETVNKVMLTRTARGIRVDQDYLAKYAEQVDTERKIAEAELAAVGLEGGAGKSPKIIAYLEESGQLPANWPRTPTGNLRSTKDDLAALDHPLARAQRALAESDKVMGYLAKVSHQAEVTGRCHPQVGILGASATGRMAANTPEYQQFSAPARPIFLSDERDGAQLWSIDWSQIEPVTMGLMARDEKFVEPYEAGEDLYEPIMRACGIDRPLAKVVLLATMYGQGDKGLAGRINKSQEQAAQIRRQMNAAMPGCARWMTKVQAIAESTGRVITGGGRVLPVDKGGIFRSVNYVIQGTAYDVLANTIVEMDRQGLGDHVLLGMHDELVIDGPQGIADEVEQIMLTPPKFLEKWAGRTPVLRCDKEATGKSWAKV